MSEAEAPHLLTEETEDGILIATLNRPEKLNALSRETMDLLTDAVIHFRDTDALKVMLIRATGRYFSAGADLRGGNQKRISPTGHTARGIRENHRLNLNNMQQLWDEMEHIEKPFVVAHHAMCVGGGLEMSLSCDFRLAAKSAAYAFPEGLMGVLPAGGVVPGGHHRPVRAAQRRSQACDEDEQRTEQDSDMPGGARHDRVADGPGDNKTPVVRGAARRRAGSGS